MPLSGKTRHTGASEPGFQDSVGTMYLLLTPTSITNVVDLHTSDLPS